LGAPPRRRPPRMGARARRAPAPPPSSGLTPDLVPRRGPWGASPPPAAPRWGSAGPDRRGLRPPGGAAPGDHYRFPCRRSREPPAPTLLGGLLQGGPMAGATPPRGPGETSRATCPPCGGARGEEGSAGPPAGGPGGGNGSARKPFNF
jgi:hypothetical protein